MAGDQAQHGVDGDDHGLPFIAESFDAVSCFQVREHENQPEQVIWKLQQMLKPEDRRLLSVSNPIDLGLERLGIGMEFFLSSPWVLFHKEWFNVR